LVLALGCAVVCLAIVVLARRRFITAGRPDAFVKLMPRGQREGGWVVGAAEAETAFGADSTSRQVLQTAFEALNARVDPPPPTGDQRKKPEEYVRAGRPVVHRIAGNLGLAAGAMTDHNDDALFRALDDAEFLARWLAEPELRFAARWACATLVLEAAL